MILGVADLRRSESFYRDVLGFWPLKRSEKSVTLAQDHLELVLENGGLSKDLPAGFRFGFSVGTWQDVDRWCAYLETRGVKIKKLPCLTDYGKYLLFLDPDGYSIEVWWDSP